MPSPKAHGMSYGLGPNGYDIRASEGHYIASRESVLIGTMETFHMPNDVMANICDKSTMIRSDIRIGNSTVDAGFQGFLTIEVTYLGNHSFELFPGMPIAHLVFHLLDQPTDIPYTGKYQDQAAGPQVARLE